MNRSIACILIVIIIASLVGCDNSSTKRAGKLFEFVDPDQSGVKFRNDLKEDSVVNYFTYPYIYMGGGVAVGDLNNDGMQDIYLTGNMVDNKLYINRGDLVFDDITETSGTSGDDRWMTGAAMADVNADGWLDIYVSVSGKFTTSKNLMYINQGVNEDGIPTFKEMAEQMGIADEGRTTQGTFFDYDNDGDLDLYNANYPYTSFKTMNPTYQMLMFTKNPEKSDKLYRNNGDGTFTDVTGESGILNFGLGLSATVGDFNKDGWQDIYVSNDFATPDYFYFNNGDGTFTDQLFRTTQHTSFFGMGADVSDFNNDGLLDIVQLDMTPEDNRRNKANMASMDPAGFWEMVGLGFHFQYMQNSFQLNNGIHDDGYPRFSDIARLAGISSTDWSWSALMTDLNNDGWKDIFITNGTRKDINNKDYFKKIDNASPSERKNFDYLKLSKGIPNEAVPNYVFQNNGDLSFRDVSEEWGLDFTGYSNGAAYADLDNDGDLELIVNNIDDFVTIHKNLSRENGSGNYLRIKLAGEEGNPQGLGAKIQIDHPSNQQYHEHTLTRGFQSTVEPYVHFGLGSDETVNSIKITWLDGKEQIIENIPANQSLEIKYQEASSPGQLTTTENTPGLFADVTSESQIDYLHLENPYNDFQHEVLLPHIYSKNGPGVAVGDINGDDLDDFFVGGAINYSGAVYVQKEGGTFQRSDFYDAGTDIYMEDMGAVFIDVEGDGDQDLYVISGGNEYREGSPRLQDRIYINDGTGKLRKDENAIPPITGSGSRVLPGDFDGDGDLDLFVGGNVVPGSYPLPAKSYLLRNDSDGASVKFSDVTSGLAPSLMEMGMVTDAEWLDFDADKDLDLVVVGEWMPITFLENTDGNFSDVTREVGDPNSAGWWYSIAKGDFDNDGDMDLVAGNLGLNYKYQASAEESFDVYANDFDGNGRLDIVLSYYNDGVQFPLRGRQCSSEQMPAISVKFPDYNSFAEATITDVYGQSDLESSLHYQARNFASSYIENKGNGKFELGNLPYEVQISSINDILVEDYDNDGNLDLVVAGNIYGAEVETTRNDAGFGQYLKGNGDGTFDPIPFTESGIFLRYDTKDLAKIAVGNRTGFLAANNQDSLKLLIKEAQ